MQMPAFEKHVWAEIDLDALRHNFRAVKARAGEMPLCAVVKADSYGHGAVECAKVFAEEGAAWLAVSCLAEARQLRKAGLTLPILILGHVEPGRVPVLIQEDITAACYSLPQAKALSEALLAKGVHLVSGGTDNHLMTVDLRGTGVTGKELERRLDEVHITANKNTVPNDPEKPFVTSGVRIGTPAVTTRGFGPEEMRKIAKWIAACTFDFEAQKEAVAAEVAALTARFPLYE